jgi:hypothetical protein
MAMSTIYRYTTKFNTGDKHRVTTTVEHYAPHLDFDELLRKTPITDSSFNEPGVVRMDELHRSKINNLEIFEDTHENIHFTLFLLLYTN